MPAKKASKGRKAAPAVKPPWMAEHLWCLVQDPAALLTAFNGVEAKPRSASLKKREPAVAAAAPPDPQASAPQGLICTGRREAGEHSGQAPVMQRAWARSARMLCRWYCSAAPATQPSQLPSACCCYICHKAC